MEAMRAVLQRGKIVCVVAAPPAIERLPTDAKMAAAERCVATVTKIVSDPLQVELAGPAQLAPKARELYRFGHLPPRISMATLYSVSPIILNENTPRQKPLLFAVLDFVPHHQTQLSAVE